MNERLGIDLRIGGTAGWLSTTQGDLKVTDFADLDLVDDLSVVDQALKQRLNTRQGELWAHPEYGNPVYDILSELMTPDWFARATVGLTDCINDDPRAQCTEVRYTAITQERRVVFTISYRVLSDARTGNLVWEYAPEGELEISV